MHIPGWCLVIATCVASCSGGNSSQSGSGSAGGGSNGASGPSSIEGNDGGGFMGSGSGSSAGSGNSGAFSSTPSGGRSGGGSSGGQTSSSSGGSASSSGGATGSSSSSSSSSSGGPPPSEVMGCGTAKLLSVPDDTSAAGPWPVGVKTVMLAMTGGSRPVEVWYPAQLGSNSGVPQVAYNTEDWLPTGQAAKIPASANKLNPCNCYRDLPIDTSHGPYPVVIFIHGTGSYRTASMTAMTTWASRGFVVVAADHAGLYLTDFLITASLGGCSAGGSGVNYPSFNLSADVDAEIAALTNKTGGFSFLGSSADMSAIGISGHSQGASDAASFGNKPHVAVDMPLADLGGTIVPSTSELKSVLVVGGTSDTVVAFSSDMSAYTGSPASPHKRLVGITNGNHLDVLDVCMETNAAGQTAVQVGNQYGICGMSTLDALAKCGTVMPVTAGPAIVNYATTAVLEETLHCQNRDAAFAGMQAKYPQISTFSHTP